MITNENEFLGYLIKNADSNGKVYQYKPIKECKISEDNMMIFMDLLREKKYITTDISDIYITDLGRRSYVKPVSRFFKSSKNTLIPAFRILVEIAVALIIAMLIFKFGWN